MHQMGITHTPQISMLYCCHNIHLKITNIHTTFILLADRISRRVKIIPAVHNPSISWISSSIGTSAVMYFSPLFSLYVLTWDCPQKMLYILISSLPEKLKWFFIHYPDTAMHGNKIFHKFINCCSSKTDWYAILDKKWKWLSTLSLWDIYDNPCTLKIDIFRKPTNR